MSRFTQFIKDKFHQLQRGKTHLQQILPHNARLVISWCLAIGFPVVLMLLTEMNHMQSMERMIRFLWQSTGIAVFDVAFLASLFVAILLLTRHTFVAALTVGLPLYIFSCIEFFKYVASNTHFVLSDLLLTANAKDIAGLATLTITPWMIGCGITFVLYLFAMWFFDIHIKMHRHLGALVCAMIFAVNGSVLAIPQLSGTVFSAAGIEDVNNSSSFVMNEGFEKNNFIASLVQNGETEIQNTVKKPSDYDWTKIETLLHEGGTEATTQVQPNVITIMSESFADFRRLEPMDTSNVLTDMDWAYRNFDRLCQEGYQGEAVVPTFGGYTTRSEFELTLGLPVNSMNNVGVPHFKMSNRSQVTIPQSYKALGYETAYIHPYSGSFYSRKETFSHYGFDTMLFEEDMSLDEEDHYRRYTDDQVVFDEVVDLLKNTDEPMYIHATTMQNHQPYQSDGMTQLEYYLQGVAHTDQALGDLAFQLQQLEEPTIILLVGDHYPFFTGSDNIYQQLGINSSNSSALYVQPYLVWSNYDLDLSTMPQSRVSLFYLPHYIRYTAGVGESPLGKALREKSQQLPVYTQPYHDIARDSDLDNLTYDIVMGKQYVRRVGI
jgi:phosphoglycerol transferase MdoB-like AlkP superfamily enzyme